MYSHAVQTKNNVGILTFKRLNKMQFRPTISEGEREASFMMPLIFEIIVIFNTEILISIMK